MRAAGRDGRLATGQVTGSSADRTCPSPLRIDCTTAVSVGVPAKSDKAEYVLWELDPVTGLPLDDRPPVASGSLPHAQLLEPGYYRFDIDAGEAGIAQVLVPAGAFRDVHPIHKSGDGFLDARPLVSLPDSYIDRCEVGNSEYEEFLMATVRPGRPSI